MLRITNLRVPVDDETPLRNLAARRLRLPPGAIATATVIRRAIDARRKAAINFVYSLDVALTVSESQVIAKLRADRDVTLRSPEQPQPVIRGRRTLEYPPVIVGAGPAGLMAALVLAENGYRPRLLERGRDVDRRSEDVATFWRTGKLDTASNVQFGEGGAGAFSDGKLTTRVNDPRMGEVLDALIAAGAPPEIKHLHKPHIGTDILRETVKNLRRRIIAAGGQVEFEARITDLEITGGRLSAVIVNETRRVPCSVALLAIGHSARDTYSMLHARGVAMEAKPFAIGVRIEHPQELVDKAQYGPVPHPRLGAADYALVYHDKAAGRTAYSFCMCPGGLVVAAASEPGGVVTNGMSLFSRASGLANSALAVNVTPDDFDGVLGGMEFQRRFEQLAFVCGGGNYFAPVQTVGQFLTGTTGKAAFGTDPSYRPGTTPADLRQCLPAFVSQTLAKALPDFGRKITGFDHPGAVLTGIETRTSSPVRLVRGLDHRSIGLEGLYPMGEGAGYAGGIMSAALDGMNTALAIIAEYKSL